MRLSKNFTLIEMTRSEAATRGGFDNTPPPDAVENLRALCTQVLQPLRDAMGRTMRVNSAYRGPDANRAVGGSATSDHCFGRAADIEVDGFDNKKLAQKIVDMGLPFKQLILEFYVPGDPNSGWVHVAYDAAAKTPKREVLRAVRQNGKTAYLKGLE
jgi:zinc D-Ala-D-Ala carboxypeptidase